MLKNDALVAKIGVDTAENERPGRDVGDCPAWQLAKSLDRSASGFAADLSQEHSSAAQEDASPPTALRLEVSVGFRGGLLQSVIDLRSA